MRTVREIYDVLFAFAPERMKMGDWDNVGLLCGRFTTEVETVLVALDPLPDVIAEAVELGAQCIVTHHPLFFDPPRAINETTLAGRSVLELIEHGIAAVNLHTNLDCAPGGVNDALAAKLEPRAPSSSARLAAVEKLAGQGIFTGVLLMPVLPFLEDTPDGVRRLVRAAYNAGARFVYPAFGVTLRQNQRAYFLDRLDELFPGAGLRARYVRQFGTQYECRSPRARELWQAFTGECRATGLLYGMQDIVAAYRQGYGSGQLSFL